MSDLVGNPEDRFSDVAALLEISPNMDIASKFKIYNVFTCQQAFRTAFSCEINFNSNNRESVNFQKMPLLENFKDISCIKFLLVGAFEA